MMTLVLAYQHKHMPNKQFLCANIVIGCILIWDREKDEGKISKTNTFIRPARYNVASGVVQIAIQSPEQQNDLSLPELQSW